MDKTSRLRAARADQPTPGRGLQQVMTLTDRRLGEQRPPDKDLLIEGSLSIPISRYVGLHGRGSDIADRGCDDDDKREQAELTPRGPL